MGFFKLCLFIFYFGYFQEYVDNKNISLDFSHFVIRCNNALKMRNLFANFLNKFLHFTQITNIFTKHINLDLLFRENELSNKFLNIVHGFECQRLRNHIEKVFIQVTKTALKTIFGFFSASNVSNLFTVVFELLVSGGLIIYNKAESVQYSLFTEPDSSYLGFFIGRIEFCTKHKKPILALFIKFEGNIGDYTIFTSICIPFFAGLTSHIAFQVTLALFIGGRIESSCISSQYKLNGIQNC